MEQLRAFVIKTEYKNMSQTFEIKEKDMDDSICYEVFLHKTYLFTISVKGKVLFNSDSNDMDLTSMKMLIDKIKEKI